MKKISVILILAFLSVCAVAVYFYFKSPTEKKTGQQTMSVSEKINKGFEMMDGLKKEMPAELLDVHNYLAQQISTGKFTLHKAGPEYKDIVMYHDAKSQSIFINTKAELQTELWIPIFYHEVAHNYWHTKHPVATEEEFKAQLLDSENYAYKINAEAWDLVIKNYPVEDKNLNELEKKLFKNYNQETDLYNAMEAGDTTAIFYWNKIIEADLQEQKKY